MRYRDKGEGRKEEGREEGREEDRYEKGFAQPNDDAMP